MSSLIRKTLRQYDTGLISAYEAYCLIREHSPEISETDVIFLIIGGRYDFSFVVVV